MLRVVKETIKKSKINLEINADLKKELELYLKVSKKFKFADKAAKLNDIIEAALNELVNAAEYKELKDKYIEAEIIKKNLAQIKSAKNDAKAEVQINK